MSEALTAEFNICDPENEMLLQAYQKENYQCIDTGVVSDICYIFFSSNGLYYPDTKEVFEEQILQKDRYEWKWVVKNSQILNIAGRIIYVRDIYKRWYTKGINTKTDTIEKTIELLKKLTDGYRVITVGSSAGGYMAVLTATKLKAKFCINFSGQYVISRELCNPYTDISGLLKKYTGSVFYFFPAHCEDDIKQYNFIKNINCVNSFLFNEKKHASTMLTGNMSYIIDKSESELLQLCKVYTQHEISKLDFLFKTVPKSKAVGILEKELKSFFIRKMGKHCNGI